MKMIADTECYSSRELAEKMGKEYSLKRLEYLRNLGLLPRPIKVNDNGKGTSGYYPHSTLAFLRHIETERKNGKSYPEILKYQEERILAHKTQVDDIRSKHWSSKNVIYLDLRTGELTEVRLKPTGMEKSKLNREEVQGKLDELKSHLRELFQRGNCLTPGVLIAIKHKIGQIESLRKSLGYLTKTEVYLRQASWKKTKK